MEKVTEAEKNFQANIQVANKIISLILKEKLKHCDILTSFSIILIALIKDSEYDKKEIINDLIKCIDNLEDSVIVKNK